MCSNKPWSSCSEAERCLSTKITCLKVDRKKPIKADDKFSLLSADCKPWVAVLFDLTSRVFQTVYNEVLSGIVGKFLGCQNKICKVTGLVEDTPSDNLYCMLTNISFSVVLPKTSLALQISTNHSLIKNISYNQTTQISYF